MKIKIFILILLLIFVNQFLYADPPNWEHLYGTEYSMVLIAEVTFDGGVFEGNGNNMLGAFGPDGVSDCRAVGIWQPANPPYYDGYWYLTIVGDVNGQEIYFKIYDEVTDSIYDCNEIIVFEDGETIGSPVEPYMLTSYLTDVNDSNIPPVFQLSQNIPNPFNERTFISYSLPKSSNVKLQIYNLKGQLVETLVDEDKPAGFHYLIWKAKEMSSGIYFYKLHTDTFTSIKKCIILK